jgi:Arc/MetJ family transcription regulator
MRTNIVLDEELVSEAFSVSDARTKKELIHEALRVMISMRKRKDLTDLSGKIQLIDNYNHKALRKLRK